MPQGWARTPYFYFINFFFFFFFGGGGGGGGGDFPFLLYNHLFLNNRYYLGLTISVRLQKVGQNLGL